MTMTRKGLMTTVAAAALAALPWVGVVQAQPPGPPPGREFGPGGPGGPGFGPRLAEELGLSDDQKAQLEALRGKQRETLRPLMESARQAHEAFQTALDADNPDAANRFPSRRASTRTPPPTVGAGSPSSVTSARTAPSRGGRRPSSAV